MCSWPGHGLHRRELCARLLARGHQVSALVRSVGSEPQRTVGVRGDGATASASPRQIAARHQREPCWKRRFATAQGGVAEAVAQLART